MAQYRFARRHLTPLAMLVDLAAAQLDVSFTGIKGFRLETSVALA